MNMIRVIVNPKGTSRLRIIFSHVAILVFYAATPFSTIYANKGKIKSQIGINRIK